MFSKRKDRQMSELELMRKLVLSSSQRQSHGDGKTCRRYNTVIQLFGVSKLGLLIQDVDGIYTKFNNNLRSTNSRL